MNDTEPHIAELMRRRLMERSGAERVLMASRMFDAAKKIVLSSFSEDLSDIEIRSRLCERLYGHEVEAAAFSKYLQSLPPKSPTHRTR